MGSANALAAVRDMPFLAVTALNAVLLLHSSMITVGLPLWISHRTDSPTWLVSAIIVINTVGVACLLVRSSKYVSTVADAARAGLRSGLFLGAACLVIAITSETSGIATVVALLVVGGLHLGGELLQAAAAWTFAFDLAPDRSQGQCQGVFNAGLDVTALLSPAIFSLLVLSPGAWGRSILAALFVLAGLGLRPVAAWAMRRHEAGDTSTVRARSSSG